MQISLFLPDVLFYPNKYLLPTFLSPKMQRCFCQLLSLRLCGLFLLCLFSVVNHKLGYKKTLIVISVSLFLLLLSLVHKVCYISVRDF